MPPSSPRCTPFPAPWPTAWSSGWANLSSGTCSTWAGPPARGSSRLLRAVPTARGTIFDLPDAIRQARQRIGETPFAGRIEFAAGDFYRDELPAGADLAWVSAIIHQHARDDSRALFAKVYRALTPNGRIAIRDFVMDPDRIRPAAGALFAVNMLANTERGATFTFAEIAEDLQAVGFQDVQLRIPSDDMNSVVMAHRPA